jgi:hypothetical protein
MYGRGEKGRRIIELTEAFKKDDFDINKIVTKFNRVAIIAESNSVKNYDTRERKKVYYLEGSNYEMGYLLGMIAEKEVSMMCNQFAGRVVFSFIGTSVQEKIKILADFLLKILYQFSKKAFNDLPKSIRDEINGLYDGCKSVNKKTKVTKEKLIVLNLGIDVLCSMVYTGKFVLRDLYQPQPEDFNFPIMCNAFSVAGRSAGYGHYFGRDFMFPTAGIFQDLATMIIYNPITKDGRKVHPFVSITAPGIVGTISGMNINGAAIGVDMIAGANCSPEKIGTNSLLLTRLCVEEGGSAEEMVRIIRDTERGVSWDYIIADGSSGRACVVEAGSSQIDNKFSSYPPKEYKEYLPDEKFIMENQSAEFSKGIMVRWNDYRYPVLYLGFNEGLWNRYNSLNKRHRIIRSGAFSPTGYISEHMSDMQCPSCFYFAPQRENSDDIVIATNHYIIPEMRLYCMDPWTSLVSQHRADDIQWRYDELNYQINESLQKYGEIDFYNARKLADYLAPYGKHPDIYANNPRSRDGKEIMINGCTSVFDLKKKIVESHYGYYCDRWVRLSLENYF